MRAYTLGNTTLFVPDSLVARPPRLGGAAQGWRRRAGQIGRSPGIEALSSADIIGCAGLSRLLADEEQRRGDSTGPSLTPVNAASAPRGYLAW